MVVMIGRAAALGSSDDGLVGSSVQPDKSSIQQLLTLVKVELSSSYDAGRGSTDEGPRPAAWNMWGSSTAGSPRRTPRTLWSWTPPLPAVKCAVASISIESYQSSTSLALHCRGSLVIIIRQGVPRT